MTHEMQYCEGCGAPSGYSDESPRAQHCGKCPPHVCADCGQMDSIADPCTCWVSLDGMPLADIKAIFALDGSFNIGGLNG